MEMLFESPYLQQQKLIPFVQSQNHKISTFENCYCKKLSFQIINPKYIFLGTFYHTAAAKPVNPPQRVLIRS